MSRNGDPKKILLGQGIFKIGTTTVGLTRGGGQFTLEREYRPIQADGDKGMVKGRIQQEGSSPKLKFTSLEVISPLLENYYPGLATTITATAGNNVYTVSTNFAALDEVTFANIILVEGTDFDAGSDVNESAINLATALNGITAITNIYTVESLGATITITEKVAGGGNTPGDMVVYGTGVITEGTPVTSLADGSVKVSGKGRIDDTDYQDIVSFVGKTKAGKSVVIRVFNAINLENFDWTMAEKDDVTGELTYTGCYLEDSADTFEPWEIEYVN